MRFEQHLLDDIRDRLPISQVVGEHVIWDKRKSQPQKGDFWACCPFHGEKTPSFHADDRKGIYHCFGCGVTGDHFRFLTDKAGYGFPAAVERLASMAGVTLPERPRHDESEETRRAREDRIQRDREESEKRHRQRQVEADREKQQRTETAQSIWKATSALAGTHGDAYLQARGIPPVSEWGWSPDDTIRFHPGLEYFDPHSRDVIGKYPAIIGRVVDSFGDGLAIWRIYLDSEKPNKLSVEAPKLGLGPAIGGAVRIGGDAADIGGAEGMESALGAYFLENCRRPVWAFLSTSGMGSFEPPMFVERVRIYPDSDYGKLDRDGRVHDPPGITAARKLCDRLKSSGVGCVIQPIQVHGDALDLLIAKKKYEERTREHP